MVSVQEVEVPEQAPPQLTKALPTGGTAVSVTAVPEVYFAEHAKRMRSPVYQRASLPAGFAAQGPAVIEEYGSTTLVWPGDRFEIGPMHEIRVHCTRH